MLDFLQMNAISAAIKFIIEEPALSTPFFISSPDLGIHPHKILRGSSSYSLKRKSFCCIKTDLNFMILL
jgi:hypothetical protein